MNPRETLDYFERRQEAMIDAIRELVDIESPSNNVRQSEKLVDHIVDMFRQLPVDLTIERHSAVDHGDHLVVRAFPSDENAVLLLGHTDTVHPIGTNLKNVTRLENDSFFGCGIFDMKANIVLMLEAFRFFGETGEKPERTINIYL